jgi:hypothetical protein
MAPNAVSRRTFVAGMGVLAAGSTFLALHQAQLLGLDASLDELLATLQRSTFARHLDDGFRLSLDGAMEKVTLRLAGVRDLANAITFATEEQNRAYHEISFSLLFQGPAAQVLEQGSYLLRHRRIGDFMIFLVPAGADEQGQYYEAIFNRLPA